MKRREPRVPPIRLPISVESGLAAFDRLADLMVKRKILSAKIGPDGTIEAVLAPAAFMQAASGKDDSFTPAKKKKSRLPLIDPTNPLRAEIEKAEAAGKEQLNGETIDEDELYAHTDSSEDPFAQ